jgi:cholesterol transport system auxiliary component
LIRSILAATGIALALSGCALLSTPPAVQLYHFGDAPAVASRPVTAPVEVRLHSLEFSQASEGDRLLSVTGTEAAYVKGARWVTSASELFSDSLEGAFAGQAQRVRLLGRRDLTPATRLLDVDVNTFEAQYDAPGGEPVVVISARARLLRFPERTVLAEQAFEVRQPASENRLATIVEAYDLATKDLTRQIVTWTDTQAPQD